MPFGYDGRNWNGSPTNSQFIIEQPAKRFCNYFNGSALLVKYKTRKYYSNDILPCREALNQIELACFSGVQERIREV
jgi:hypothetical protein